jgi:alpha-D-ribose 1-methylphosphonate 5-triphosphate synthase subunit PhnH
MARPGRVQRLVAPPPEPPTPLAPAAAAALLTLADADTAVWTDAGPEAEAWLRFHAGCPIATTPGEAGFVLATAAPPALAALDQGTEEEPHRSATLILQVAALAEAETAEAWRLTGPGIAEAHGLAVRGAPTGFLEAWAANHARFPRGVDVLLCAGDRVAALPRTVAIVACAAAGVSGR